MTTTVTPADIKARTHEFDAYADPDIQREIDAATRRMNADAWGIRYDDGVLLLALHLLTVHARAAAPVGAAPGTGGMAARGAVSWEQMGVIQRRYNNPTTAMTSTTPWTNAWFEQTQWGQEYAVLQALVFVNRTL